MEGLMPMEQTEETPPKRSQSKRKSLINTYIQDSPVLELYTEEYKQKIESENDEMERICRVIAEQMERLQGEMKFISSMPADVTKLNKKQRDFLKKAMNLEHVLSHIDSYVDDIRVFMEEKRINDVKVTALLQKMELTRKLLDNEIVGSKP